MYRDGGGDDRHDNEKKTTEVPRLMLRPAEAAAACGVERSFFDREIAPRVRRYTSESGRVILYTPEAIMDWYSDNSESEF